MNKLKEERLKHNITLAKMAEDLQEFGLNTTPTSLARYEKWPNIGGRNPALETWGKLAEYFGVTIEYLMGDNYKETLKKSVQTTNHLYELALKTELTRIGKSNIEPTQQLVLARAIDMLLSSFEKYQRNDQILTELQTLIFSLSSLLKNKSDDYQGNIEGFVKLVNLIEAQNKKASDDKPETER